MVLREQGKPFPGMLELFWLVPTDFQFSLRWTDSAHRPRDVAVSEAFGGLYDTEQIILDLKERPKRFFQSMGIQPLLISTPVHATPLRFSTFCSNDFGLYQENTCLELQTKLAEAHQGSSALEGALEEAKQTPSNPRLDP